VDDIGILNDRPENLVNETTGAPVAELPLCERVLAETVPIFPWGDLSGRCTRGNGVLDSEDLNGDNGLNSTGPTENVFRYVVPLQPGSPYYVRDGVRTVDALGRVSKWELYRVPVRSPSATIGTPTLRSIQHMRLTVVAPDRGEPDVVARFALARLHFVGTSWVRRAETPITGLAGSLGKPDGEVIASIVSTENESDLGYTSPPGVFETTQKRGDIGSTARAYAAAYLEPRDGGTPLADAITASPYLGTDSVEPFLAACRRHGAGVFFLVRTSNAGAADVQDLALSDGRPLWQYLAALVHEWGEPFVGEHGLSSIGAVVGATYPRGVSEARRLMPQTPLLLPGVGAQGATPADVARAFTSGPASALVTASRSVIYAFRETDDDWRAAAGAEAGRLAGQVWAVSGW